jgi:sugar phosphate isomerase/epimerase
MVATTSPAIGRCAWLLRGIVSRGRSSTLHSLAHTVEECRYYFDAIDSEHLGWSFTINHATLVPEGISGFVDGMPMERLREVRVADSNGEYELHMYPGEGMIDFGDMFRRIESAGFTGHYMNGFGSLEDRDRAREYLVARAAEVGVS